MIVQLRDQKLKLFVGLLLILGRGPENCEGLQCYTCDSSVDCANQENLAHGMCDRSCDTCFKSNVSGSIRRSCYFQPWTLCILMKIPDGCYNADVHKHLNAELMECVRSMPVQPGHCVYPVDKLNPPAEGTVCVCAGTLCNGGPVEVGTTETPAPRPGLNCYSCKGHPDSCKSTKVCAQGEYCAEVSYFPNNGRVVDRRCLPQSQAECIKKDYGDCWYSKSPRQTSAIRDSIEKCANSTTKPPLGRETDLDGKEYANRMCICDQDLCNGNPANPANLAGHSTSNGNLIFVILAAAATTQRIFLPDS